MASIGKLRRRGWCPSSSDDYQVHEVAKPALRKRGAAYNSRKGHVAFKTILEEEEEKEQPIVAETHHEKNNNIESSVDEMADAFIKLEHRRIELARLKSLGLA